MPADSLLTKNGHGNGHRRLSEKDVRTLKPPHKGNRILYDGEVAGFGARITSKGVVSFVLNYRIHGRERRFTIGRAPELSVAAAREEAIQLRNRIRKGEDPLVQRERLRLDNPTMADLSQEYFSRYAEVHKRPSSVRNDRAMFDFVTAKLGKTPVNAISRQDVENLHRSFKATPYRGNRTLALRSKAFSLAVEWSWRADNPAHGVRRFPEQRREFWLKADELGRLLDTLDKYPDQQAANALRFIIFTGARKGEVLSAKWEDFDLEAGRWTKPSHHTKQKRTEHVPLSADALDVLKRMRKQAGGDGWLFPGRLNGNHLENLKNAWAEMRTGAKIGDARIHDLRHTFASHLVSSGHTLETIGRLLGHTQPQTTMRYAHLADETLRNAANSFGQIARKKAQ
jgi:integrase